MHPWLKLMIGGRKKREMQAVRKGPNPDEMGGHSIVARLVLDGGDFIPPAAEAL